MKPRTLPLPSVAGIIKKIRSLTGRHNAWEIYRDFLELAACAVSNSVDARHATEREAAYMSTAGKYERAELDVLCQILADLWILLQDEPADVLGDVFMQLELGNKWSGQFFTPQPLADLMAALTLNVDEARTTIARVGHITLSEPAVGGGVTVIGFCRAMRAAGLNYKRCLHVTAVDVDIKAVHMAYLQLALLRVPAVVVHGNTLSLAEWSHWYTPAHVHGGWHERLRARPVAQARLAEEVTA